jgi:hypothetical protein
LGDTAAGKERGLTRDKLKEAGFRVAEQLLAAEAPTVSPDQIQSGVSVVDQIPGL